MKRNFRWFRLAVLMILLLIFGTVLPGNVYAAEVKNEKEVKEEKNEKDEKDKEESYSAKVIRLLHYEGEVGIEDAEGKSAFMMENIRLSSGQALVTGPESSASVGLDDSRILSLDADTRVEFIQEKDQLELNLVKGTLFLDVQDKLDENEVLDIRTSTMAVGIRGTIVFVSVEEEGPEKQASEQKASLEDVTGTVTVGVLEGTARINSLDENGQDVYSVISAGQKATIPSNGEAAPSVRVASSGEEISQEQKLQKTGSPAVISKLEQTDLPGFVYEQIEKDDYLRQRVEESGGFLSDTPANQEDPYAADGDWTWTDQVTLVAQSASKMYDGTPLTRESDVLVYGLPDSFSIKTYAGGSQTNAGTGENPVAGYRIYNRAGEDVTSHFNNITKVSGMLVVDPTPITIWTGSAEKVYDGTPLTVEDASIRFVEGYKKEQAAWTNRSYLVTEPVGSAYNKQILYGLCGITKVHASDPYTGEIKEVYLFVGQRLTICPSAPQGEDSSSPELESGGTSSGPDEKKTGEGAPDAGGRVTVSSGALDKNSSIIGLSSFEFRIEEITEQDLPEDILRIYADNPDLLAQVCQETGWDSEVMAKRIAALPESEERETVTMDGLQVGYAEAERLMTELTNIRLTVDSDITKYYNKPLGTLEAHFTPVRIDDDITVRATGSQTDAGESQNTYEIDWGNADPNNYTVSEELGTLKVTPAPLSVTTGSDEKSYDGTPLTQAQAELSGLVNGESASVTGTGSITRVGSIPNTYSIAWGTAKKDNYVVKEEDLGMLTVTPAGKTLTITTGSASKTYDGSPLESSEVTVEGLIKGDSVTVTPGGSITDAGSVKNTYTIDWGNTDPGNYNIEENLGTLTVWPAELTISTGSDEKTYDGSALKSGGVEISGLQGTDSVTVTSTGSITDAGSVKNTYTIDWGDTDPGNYNIEENLGTLTVRPAELTISTGSDEKTYDGGALTNSEASVTGLIGDDSVTVKATGTITDAGTAQNTYTISWTGADKDNYELTEELGTLTVNKAPLTIRTGSAEKIFDGSALTSGEVSVDGLAAGETVTLTADGSITDAGETDNTYTINWGSAKESNYTLSEQLGKLKVKPMPVTFDLKAPETLYSTYAWVPGGLTASWPGKDSVPAEEENKAYGMYELAFLEAVFALPQGKVTMKIPAVSGEGEHKLSPALTFTKGKESNYEISCINDTVKMETVELTIDMNCTDSVYNGGYYIPEGLTARYSDETVVEAVEELILDDSERPVGVEASFHIKTGTLTLRINGVKDAGTYTVEPYQKALTGVSVSFGYTNNTMAIKPAPLTVETGSAEKAYDGTALTSSGVTVTGLQGDDTVTATATGSIKDVGETKNSYTIDWDGAKESNYTVTEELGTLKVTRASKLLTIRTGSSTRPYNGKPLENGEVTVEGLIGGDSVSVTAAGSITDAGSAQNTYTIDWGTTDKYNYVLKEELGTLTVSKAPLTIKTGSAEKAYDGNALTSSEVTITGLAAGETITVTPTGSITQVGSEENTCSIVWDTAKESNYDLKTELGTLTVTKAGAVLTINTGSAEKTYDGKALTSSVAAVYGLIEGDSVTVTTTGTITDAGTAQNTYTIDWGDTDKDNYTVEANLGTLTVNPKDITVSTGSAEKTYDGTALTDSEVNISGLVEGETVTVTAAGSIKDAGSVENTCSIAWGTAKEGNYNVTEEPGTLTVKRAALTVETGSATRVYNGEALTSSEVTITGLAAGENITVTPTGTITQVGSEENTCSIAWGTAKESNYDLTPVLGTLTVTKAEAELTITTPSSSKTYDGTPLVGGEATVSGLIGGDSVTVSATGTITDAGTAKNGYTIDWGETDSNNYTIVENLGTLTVNKAALTITTGSAEKTYDGTALTSSEANAAGLAAGETVTVTAAGSITDVGETKNTYTIDWDSAKEGNYTLSEELGTLKVTPLSVSFDLKAPETLDSTSAWVPEGLTVSWTGTEPAAAQEENRHSGVDDVPYLEAVFALPGGKVTMTIPSVSGEGDHTLEPVLDFTTGKASNYEITYVNDKVKMVKPELIVDMNCFEAVYFGGYLVPEGISAKYSDGTVAEAEEDFIYEEERVIGTEVLFHLKEGTLVLRIHGVKDAGTYENVEPYETELTGEDVDITYTNNTMIITPAPLTITTGSAEKVYDGEALTNSEATIDGLADGETITVTPTGSITDQGEAENTYTIGWGSTKKSNYDITEELGSLKVTPLPVTFNLYLPERLYFTDPFVPVEVLTASWPDNPETDADSTEIYGEGPSAYAEAVFTLPGGKVTMTIPAISGEGDHKVEPTLNFTEGKASNYAVEFVNNETKMGLPEVTIDMGGRQVEYGSVFAPEMEAILEDGTEVTPDVTDLTDAREYTFTINTDEYYSEVTLKFKKVTDAGTHTLTPDEVSQSVTEVNLIYKNNTLTIKPAPLTIQTGAAEKVYDGTALTNSEVTVTGDVLERVDFSSVKITANGSITDVGEADNTYTIDWGEEDADNYSVTDELGKLKVTALPVTIDLNAPETLSTTDPWIPEGVTLSYGGSKYGPEEETVVGSPGEGEYYLKDVFDLPGGKVTVETPAVSGEGTHTLNPKLTFASGNKESNYDISYTNKTVKMGAAMSPLGFSASFMAKRPAAASSGMEMLTAGVRAITETLSTEAAAMAGKETDQAGKAAAASEAAGKAASEGKEQDVQKDAAPDQTSEGEGFTDTDVLSADGEEKVQSQDPDPEEDQTAEEGGEEKKTPEPEVPGDRAPAQAESVEEKEEKPSLPDKPADKEPAPAPAPAEPVSAEPAEADSKQ